MANQLIKSVNLLPEFLRTDKNSKFLSSTLDQLIQTPQLERIDGFVGSKLTPNFVSTSDVYLSETSPLRRDYQLDPALIIKDNTGLITDDIALDDLINEISVKGGIVDNLDRLFRSDFYSYTPHIDLDKLINFQEYYWLPTGPDPIVITGQPINTISTYSVTDNELGTAYIFTPDGLTQDPLITLYRGNTYVFEVNSKHNFYIKTSPSVGPVDLYNINVTNNGTKSGLVTIVVGEHTPSTLYYVSGDEQLMQGQFAVKTISQDSRINVETEIIGKSQYVSGTGVKLSNGMKVVFGGEVLPASYQNNQYFVEGVGSAIKLIDFSLLDTSGIIASVYDDKFDADPFDDFPFDNFKSLPINPEYITINRASQDLNPWSRYNRWVHGDVITAAALANGQTPVLPADSRAKRPIIEFVANLRLYNFGARGIQSIDLIDNVTTDVFNIVEGSAGYYIDETLIQQGQRIIFNADTDPLVRGKIYQANYYYLNGKKRLELQATPDHDPIELASVCVSSGKTTSGTTWWFNGTNWQFAQQHNTLNQPPLFDLFDDAGHSYSDKSYYLSNFSGNLIFSYGVGTGTIDSVLGFPLEYKNSVGVGSYVFKNNLTSDTFSLSTQQQTTISVSAGQTYCQFTDDLGNLRYANAWTLAQPYQIPIIQFQSTTTSTNLVQLTALDNPVTAIFNLEVYVNNVRLAENTFFPTVVGKNYFIRFNNQLNSGDNVLFKIYTTQPTNDQGYYEPPLGLTNNPLNGPIKEFTLTELSDHLQTIVNRDHQFSGVFPGSSNLRDLSNLGSYGTRLISNANPLVFAHFFIGKKEHNVVDAITKAGEQYNQFKMSLLTQISELSLQTDPSSALDTALITINSSKNHSSPYYLSDMLAYGTNVSTRTWIVTDSRNTTYPISSAFDITALSTRSVLVYLNGIQLTINQDYNFDVIDSSVVILKPMSQGDQLAIKDYPDTLGSFVPPTPSKLGLYPKYQPKIYLDDTYAQGPVNVIQGHDGSIMVAFNDYRDDIILEFERRVYNNIKADYRAELFDINSVNVGAFRENQFSQDEINQILAGDFIRWAGFYGIDYTTNNSFDEANSFTWNYFGGYSNDLQVSVTGYWRSIFNYFYDTDRPHTHPWEMLGIADQPEWWTSTYGPAPYTSGNQILWQDLEDGMVRGPIQAINTFYARPGLSKVLPVDQSGNLIDPSVSLISNITAFNRRQSWIFGDQGPAETAWRRSSYWPFAVQRLLALTKPASYAALMYDPAHMSKNIAGQWTYGSNHTFLHPADLLIHGETSEVISGYGVYVAEIGTQRTSTYITQLRQDLNYLDFNLFYKVGGFISQDKLRVKIDAYDPISTSIGALLSPDDYTLRLNVSNPIKSIGISGIIIQKTNGIFVVKGYDRSSPYFDVLTPKRNSNTSAITVGGISETYLNWSGSSSTGGNTGLTAADLTTAKSAVVGNFYQQGQIVAYGGKFYRVTVSHRGESVFNPSYYQIMAGLPTKGGATVQIASGFSTDSKMVPYGTEFSNIQEVYDFIIGYGQWLINQGFIFEEFNSDFGSLVDWDFTAKEFLYWATQNWANNSVIALSPFANQLKYSLPNSVVDNIFDSFYEYSLQRADGTSFPQKNLTISRQDGVFTIATLNTTDGIYYAKLNSVQKEHAMVFNNTTMFNDTIYDIETGYRQARVRLTGFRTSGWNGDYFSPGFVYDTAQISIWEQNQTYQVGSIVRFNGNYYAANSNVASAKTFDFTAWDLLGEKPVAGLIPNFDYKIKQFEDFYSLDVDNFDAGQETMAQHLTGYTPRVYLNNIFTNPISQYKFYQGFIREKGTKNSITKLAKASIQNMQGQLTYTEEWAFRVGQYGSYNTYQELEVPLIEGNFLENPQIVSFVDVIPISTSTSDVIYYRTPADITISPDRYNSFSTFAVNSGTYLDNNFVLATAGYARLDDVTATAYNENSLLDIANNRNLSEGDVIWLGFKQNGDWDVLRYESQKSKIVGVFVSSPASEITFTTDLFHGLSVGDLVSVTQFNSQVDGVYFVTAIPKLNQFSVASTLLSITNAALPSPGKLFKFVSARISNFDNFPADDVLLTMPEGTLMWVDDDGFERWAVYQKINNYDYTTYTSQNTSQVQQFGWSIGRSKQSDLFVVSAPAAYKQIGSEIRNGIVYGYQQLTTSSLGLFNYSLNDSYNTYTADSQTNTELGYALSYDDTNFNGSGHGLIFAGAPATSNVLSSGITFSPTAPASSYINQGVVKISSIDPVSYQEVPQLVIVSPTPDNYQRFGSSLYVQKNTSTKILLVGATGTQSTGTGHVYSYTIDARTSTVTATFNTEISPQTGTILSTSDHWGYSISGSDDATVVAISAPGHSSNSGLVQIFSGITGLYNQTITPPASVNPNGIRFGQSVLVSPDGNYLFVSATEARDISGSIGKVFVYKQRLSGMFGFDQVLTNPVGGTGMKFGISMDIDSTSEQLIISAQGTNKTPKTTFDVNTGNQTTLDGKTTNFYGAFYSEGTAYTYSRKFSRFVLAQELHPSVSYQGSNYGNCVSINDAGTAMVGSPAYSNPNIASSFSQFYRIDSTVGGYTTLRSQDSTVDVSVIERVALIDTFNETVMDYLDIIDPLKGKIAGIADQEIKYKSAFDPAVYSIGIPGTVNDLNTSWLDEHVGELWWDLSTAKYFWYEQGEAAYRKNNWGRLFNGATIDVYEWVGSPHLPTEWSSLADTPAGLVDGISGQPKFADNTVLSVKQVYDTATQSFYNYYYFWVKNKVTVPVAKNRRLGAYQVASIIADPTAYGLEYVSILSSNSIALSNIGTKLVSDRISVNIAFDTINNSIPRHTEWLILSEGSENSRPNSLLEKKLIDSLLGHDSLGNPVPDPNISSRIRYGLGIRPQQTLFKDRYQAIRNIIEFSNNILISTPVTGNYEFSNLNAQEQLPNEFSHLYDQIVEDQDSLNNIDVRLLQVANLVCTVSDGKIDSVSVTNSGFGYKVSPTVSISSSSGANAVITTEIDANGKVISATIVNSGSGYSDASPPLLTVRTYTVIVLADSLVNNKWAIYSYDTAYKQWIRSHTQSFNTTLYWNYVDWASSDFNKYLDYSFTVNDVYELETIDVTSGQYVKVNNGGDGRYIILNALPSGSIGTFSPQYDLVFKHQGTIQLSNNLWDLADSNYGFAQNNSYDQTLYDQAPDLELEYIIKALRDDLFVGNLKVNWNLLFFTAVRYALTEQKLLDWAFKTSFISAVNMAGPLDQRPVFKLTSSTYYEQYLDEIKPYHTQVRNYTTNNTVLEPTNTYTTDFDLPSVYDREQKLFTVLSGTDIRFGEYPWKSWTDNHKYQIESISVGHSGSGYLVAPDITIITAPGDTGYGATAEAYIRSGKVISVMVTNSGNNYTQSPIIELIGGGNVDLVPAVLYANLGNGLARTNKISMKFDRISRMADAGYQSQATDQFVCDGSSVTFILNWLAVPDKSTITVLLDDALIFDSEYTVRYFTKTYQSYDKQYCEIVFLDRVPLREQVLVVHYEKNIKLLDATQRIVNYYTATSGMPGLDLGQLMYGIDYPQTEIMGLPLDYTTRWDISYAPFGTTVWADDVSNYNLLEITSVSATGTSVLSLNTTTGLAIGQLVNIVSAITNKFSTSTDVTITSISSGTITVSSALSQAVHQGEKIEIWSYDSNSSLLDSVIEGGSWSNTTSSYLMGALGINPADIIIDGDYFLTPNTSYAPEELVPGQVLESLGINVYTKNPQGAPIVVSSSFDVVANTTITQTLSIVPPNIDSIAVTFDSRIFVYTTATTFYDESEFTMNWETNQITIPPQNKSGKLGYTIISIGGGIPDQGAGVVDSASITVQGVNTAQVHSLAAPSSIRSAYVTVNGQTINSAQTSTNAWFTLNGPDVIHQRAAIDVYNLNTGTNTITAWFFSEPYQYFNETRAQTFTIGDTPQTTFVLNQPPRNIEPAVAQIMVQLEDITARKRLRPPYISYYQVTNNINQYAINNHATLPPNTFNMGNIRAYANGSILTTSSYTVNSATGSITIGQQFIKNGDVIAIVALNQGGWDYDIADDDTLVLAQPIFDAILTVTTFTDQDSMMMRTERFIGNPARRYVISRPALNNNYVWVEVNGFLLVDGVEYYLLDDNVTIQLSDTLVNTPNDSVVIVSISSSQLATTILGYRIFEDLLGRTHFKRLSGKNTTYLTQPLKFTDTEIYVADASVLTQPIISKKIPGIIIIAGERIEFFKVQNNILSNLRRGTLGTAPNFYSEYGTNVIDQGSNQTIPFTEKTLVQHQLTTATTNTYVISTLSNRSHLSNAIDGGLSASLNLEDLDGGASSSTYISAEDVDGGSAITTYSSNPVIGDGIVLSTDSEIPAIDQVKVYYGGRLLSKTGRYHQDIMLSYDSPIIVGEIQPISDTSLLPPNTVIGQAVLVTSTNQVWVYEKSIELDSINGYVYRGLNYIPPEFTINLSTQEITLNIMDGIRSNVKLTIVKQEFERSTLWNDEITTTKTKSLMDSNTIPAKFLQARPTELPNWYYYGGDLTLTSEDGFALTDNTGQPLQGY
jgi:hypothetical protein